MEIAAYTPKTVASLLLPLEEVRIMPLGDIQYGEQGCDVDRLERHIKWGLDHDCWFIGMGDYLDPGSPSNRRALSIARADLYDSVRDMLDEAAERKQRELEEILAPTRGRWLGLVSGHHLWPYPDGSTSDTRLAQFLGTRYMGDGAAMTILHFQKPKGHHGYAKLWYCHGEGSAQTPGAILSKLFRIAECFEAHAYVMGHVHQKGGWKKPRIDVVCTPAGRIRWQSNNRVFAVSGGFLKGYEMGRTNNAGYPSASYVEKGMMPPTTLGGVMLYVRPRLIEGRINIDLDISF